MFSKDIKTLDTIIEKCLNEMKEQYEEWVCETTKKREYKIVEETESNRERMKLIMKVKMKVKIL